MALKMNNIKNTAAIESMYKTFYIEHLPRYSLMDYYNVNNTRTSTPVLKHRKKNMLNMKTTS